MRQRRSQYDVTNRIKVTDTRSVTEAVREIYAKRFPGRSPRWIDKVFGDFDALFNGQYRDFHGCDTRYHDIQHSLDVTLAMTRLLAGHDHAHARDRVFGADRWRLGIITALFHDSGYFRHKQDRRHTHGAEYTKIHVTRSGRFLHEYLSEMGLEDDAQRARRLVHYTGYEIPLQKIRLHRIKDKNLGRLLGTADLLAQIADRCYLEKCRDYLFEEFELGGLTKRINGSGKVEVIYASPEDLLRKTPEFIEFVRERLEQELGGVYRHITDYFGSNNPYLSEIELNLKHLHRMLNSGDFAPLRRRTPYLDRSPSNQ